MMTGILQFLLLPFTGGLLLSGINAYFGLHVIARRDTLAALSLAQLAALGISLSVLKGNDAHAPASYLIAIGFTMIGAAVAAFVRSARGQQVPRETVFAILFTVSAAAAVIVLSKSSGDEHLRNMLAGNVLSVTAVRLLKTGTLFAVVALLHYFFRRQLLIPADGSGTSVTAELRDFLFYATLGVAIASSVAIAGVLLVVTWLLAPSAAAMLFFSSTKARIAAGWIGGTLVSAIAILLSFKLDVPTGATIVCTFGIALALVAIVWAIKRPRLT